MKVSVARLQLFNCATLWTCRLPLGLKTVVRLHVSAQVRTPDDSNVHADAVIQHELSVLCDTTRRIRKVFWQNKTRRKGFRHTTTARKKGALVKKVTIRSWYRSSI